MAKILAVAKHEKPQLYEDYLDRLKEEFSAAISTTLDPDEVVDFPGERTESVEEPSTEPAAVSQQATETPKETTEEMERTSVSIEEILEDIGVESPFERMKVEKVLDALSENPNIELNEVVNITGLSEEAVEKYLNKLETSNYLSRNEKDNYRITVSLQGSE